MSISLQLLLCIWAASQTIIVDATLNPQDLLDQLVNTSVPEELAPALCGYCASLNCPNPNNPSVFPGWVANQEGIEECRSCSDPFTKDCFCTKKYHPKGCTLRDCGPEDGVAYPDSVVGYTCYCTQDYKPLDCVSRSNPSHPRCEPSEEFAVRDDCQCNSETSDPDNCNIRVCDPDELAYDGYRCICGPRCDQRPDGCVKELKL